METNKRRSTCTLIFLTLLMGLGPSLKGQGVEQSDREKAAQIPVPPGYRMLIDQTYVRVGDWDGKMDIYLPPRTKTPSPVVLKIHGGSWNHGSRVAPGGVYFDMGFAVVNVEYRFVQVAPAPAAIEDTRCALKYVIKHAGELNIDPHKIVLQGGSAGGHLSLITGLLGNDIRFDKNCPDGESVHVAAIVDEYGPSDFTRGSWDVINHNKSVVTWLGTRAQDESFKAAVSPVSYVQRDSPPVLIIHGDQDHTVPIEQSRVLEDAHLVVAERCGRFLKDALEGGDTRLALFFAGGLLLFVLLLLAVELGLALSFPALLLGLVLGQPLLMLGLALCRFLLRLFFGSFGHRRRRFDFFALQVVGMHRAFVVKADGDGVTDTFTENDDGGFRVRAGRLRVGVIRFLKFLELVAIQCAGALLLGRAPRGFYGDELRPRGNLPVKESLNLALVAGGVEALCGIRATGKCFPLARRRRAPA